MPCSGRTADHIPSQQHCFRLDAIDGEWCEIERAIRARHDGISKTVADRGRLLHSMTS